MGKFREAGKNFINLHTQRSFWQQAVGKKEKIKMQLQAVLITLLTAWLYYRSAWAVFILWPASVWYYRKLYVECTDRKKNEFLIQFKEMIQSMAASMRAGYSAENAMTEAERELKILYPDNALIVKEVCFMTRQMRIQIPMEQVLEEFAERVRLEDVRNFSGVFGAAKRSGGDMMAIIRETADQIGDKIDVLREIDTILAARRYEFRVMSYIPYGIIAYLTLSFPEFTDCLYGNIAGMGVMSICFVIYAVAYGLGARMVKIEV